MNLLYDIYEYGLGIQFYLRILDTFLIMSVIFIPDLIKFIVRLNKKVVLFNFTCCPIWLGLK